MTALVASFLIFLVIGVPIALVLALSAVAYLVFSQGMSLSVVPRQIFAGLDQFVLMSIPFFILSGGLMNESQLTERLIRFANYLVGRWRGGLAQATTLASMFFGGITGAATAEVAALGPILIPAMEKQGYPRSFAVAVTVASSLCGPLIPPSIPMLVYGLSSGASIGALFLAGATPGVAVGLGMLLLNRYLIRHMHLSEGNSRPSRAEGSLGAVAEFVASLRAATLALLMPVIIVGGVVGGIVTPTESSVLAVVYALVVGLVLRTMSWRAAWNQIMAATLVSSTVMLIVAAAALLGWVFAYERIPQAIAEFFLSVTQERWVFLLMVVILLLLVGLILETSGAIIILTPVLFPASQAYGIDPVHFGVVIVFGLVIGLLTPPVGLCLFVGCSIGNVSMAQLTRALIPYLIMLIGIYLFFVFVPEASLWLPRLLS